jgi:NAD(P)-dependent dehydrogenase (short-subunit alcohol dehydrogenase family)
MANWGPFTLDGKFAVVTGGAAGIGLGIVKGLSQAGATVMAVGRRADGAEIIAREAPDGSYFQADLASADAPERVLDEAVRRYGTVDILINNAAALGNHPLETLTAAAIDHMCAVNVRAVLLLIAGFAKVRKAAGGGGKIVNIGSMEGFVAALPAGMGPYGATKTAVRGLTVSLARELGPLGIGVNAIAPGAVIHENLFGKKDPDAMKGDALTKALEALKAKTNTGRLGTPEDIAGICVFLASRASDYVSGQVIVADGGTIVN